MKRNALINSVCSLIIGLSIFVGNNQAKTTENTNFIDEKGNYTVPFDIAEGYEYTGPKTKYDNNSVLIKSKSPVNESSFNFKVNAVKKLTTNSCWYEVSFTGIDAFNVVKNLRRSNSFDLVDYNYLMNSSEDLQMVDVSSNPSSNQNYFDAMRIKETWDYQVQNDLPVAGENIVVAVIDTGVDYTHDDLEDNIWINVDEIPNNGIDDDQNGYIDDFRGWDFANEDNDPMDDNGHGTHVSGIIAASNNNIGSVGVAYNAKIMPIKAGYSTGTFTNSAIASAIEYAYYNGASVINMSFGSASISIAIQEALELAYSSCVLVAATGNQGKCNLKNCFLHQWEVTYPASLSYVLGVGSCNHSGNEFSPFSNFDHVQNSAGHYELAAFGESVYSTWLSNNYMTLSGTSMAAPMVSGVAAMMRSVFSDRTFYSTKYIYSCINNNTNDFIDLNIGPSTMRVCDSLDAFITTPNPEINTVTSQYIFDRKEFSSINNNDGFINSGETVKIAFELRNTGIKASDINVTLIDIVDTENYFEATNIVALNNTFKMPDIGTYSEGDAGRIYEGDQVIDMENGFMVKVDPITPNSFEFEVRVKVEYKNGLNDDGEIYSFETSLVFSVLKGTRISGVIENDTIFTNETSYVITDSVIIPKGVTVEFKEGTIIEFYGDNASYINTIYNSPEIIVYGSLIISGTEEEPVQMYQSANFKDYQSLILFQNCTSILIEHANLENVAFVYDMQNPTIRFGKVDNFIIRDSYLDLKGGYIYQNGTKNFHCAIVNVCQLEDSELNITGEKYLPEFYTIISSVNSIIRFNNTDVEDELNIHYQHYLDVMDVTTSFSNNMVIANSPISFYIGFTTASSYFDQTDEAYYCNSYFENNLFALNYTPESLGEVGSVRIDYQYEEYNVEKAEEAIIIKGNVFDEIYVDNSAVLVRNNFHLETGKEILNLNDRANFDATKLPAFVTDITIFDNSNNETYVVKAKEDYEIRVEFSKSLSEDKSFSLMYGSIYPYADFVVTGEFVSDKLWVGHLNVQAFTEGGIQTFYYAGFNDGKELIRFGRNFEFTIDSTEAFSMMLQAEATEEGVQLTWYQDDYDTLLGYNVYASDYQDGFYTKLNQTIIPKDTNTFLDTRAEPGSVVWYTFTVVFTDFTESKAAGKVAVKTLDTVSPNIYHTPINQGYAGNNISFSCSVSDNIGVTDVNLYYRIKGESSWSTIPMIRTNDKYVCILYGEQVKLEGIEYYISASDGTNTITLGSSDNPYSIIVKDASAIAQLGDVDGDSHITTKDALMIMKAINEDLILTDDQFKRADLNFDGILSSVEALRILQFINGNVDTLEM